MKIPLRESYTLDNPFQNKVQDESLLNLKKTNSKEIPQNVESNYFNHDAGYRVITYNSSEPKNVKKSLPIGLIFATCLFLLASLFLGGIIYANSSLNEMKIAQQRCLQSAKNAISAGLNINLKCRERLGPEDVLNKQVITNSYNDISKSLDDLKNDLDLLNNNLQSQIDGAKSKLEILGFDTNKIPNVTYSGNLSTNLETRKDLLNNLNLLLDTEKEKIDDLLVSYSEVLESNESIDLKDYKEFYKSFSAKSENDKITNYKDLQNKYIQLENYIEKEKIRLEILTDKTNLNLDINAYKILTGKEFQDLINNFDYKEVTETKPNQPILGNSKADQRIVKIAEERGYKLRKQAIENNLMPVEGEKLQKNAKDDYLEMKAAAKKEGISLGLVSGYRSAQEQKELFVSRFNFASNKAIGRGYTFDEIIQGDADDVINLVFDESSIPGYSRHHTGYALDLTDSSSSKYFTEFEQTKAFAWISANNYYNAKKFGFVPSYPKGLGKAGPNPESWEYIWVGKSTLITS